MPNIESAKKALRQNVRRRAVNLNKKSAYKAAVKDYRKLVASKQKEEAISFLPKVYQALDKAAKTNVIKKNKASRLKSRLAAMLVK